MENDIHNRGSKLRWALPGAVWLVLWSVLPEELDTLGVIDVGGMHVCVPDVMYIILVVASLSVLLRRQVPIARTASAVYLLFLAWLVICTFRGFAVYGYRAFGEVRYAMPFFGFLYPFALLSGMQAERGEAVRRMLFASVVIAGVTGLVMLVVEVSHGGRFFFTEAMRKEYGVVEDFRGIRYLGTTQTFNILALAVFLLVNAGRRLDHWRWNIIAGVSLMGAALLTRNRAALISICVAGISTLLLFKRVRQVIVIALVVVLGVVAVELNPLSDSLNIGASLLSGLSPEGDDTGSWRLLQSAAAIEKGMESPLIGDGFGGYFYLEVPGMPPIDAIVHNQFVLLFLKCGVIGVVLCLGWLSWFLAGFLRSAARARTAVPSSIWMEWLIIVAMSQLLYGLAYPFTPIFGFYMGCGAILLSDNSSEETPNLPPPGVSPLSGLSNVAANGG